MFEKIIVLLLLFSSFYSLVSNYTSAQGPANPVSGFFDPQYAPPITQLGEVGGSGYGLAEKLVNWLIGIFWIIAVGFVVWAAFIFLFANGEDDKISAAKQRLKYALIAAIVALLATGIKPITMSLLRGETGGDGYSGSGFGAQCISYTYKKDCEKDLDCEWNEIPGPLDCGARECDDFGNASECNSRAQCEWVKNKCKTVYAKCATNLYESTCNLQSSQCHWDGSSCVAD